MEWRNRNKKIITPKKCKHETINGATGFYPSCANCKKIRVNGVWLKCQPQEEKCCCDYKVKGVCRYQGRHTICEHEQVEEKENSFVEKTPCCKNCRREKDVDYWIDNKPVYDCVDIDCSCHIPRVEQPEHKHIQCDIAKEENWICCICRSCVCQQPEQGEGCGVCGRPDIFDSIDDVCYEHLLAIVLNAEELGDVEEVWKKF